MRVRGGPRGIYDKAFPGISVPVASGQTGPSLQASWTAGNLDNVTRALVYKVSDFGAPVFHSFLTIAQLRAGSWNSGVVVGGGHTYSMIITLVWGANDDPIQSFASNSIFYP